MTKNKEKGLITTKISSESDTLLPTLGEIKIIRNYYEQLNISQQIR